MKPDAGRIGRVVVGALLIPLFVAQAQADGPPDCSVLSIGINKYRSNDVPDLRGAVNDAKSIAGVFRGQGSRAKVRELLDQDATHLNIVAALDKLEADLAPGETAVIFLSGHGRRFTDDWEFICHDFKPTLPGDASKGATLSGVWLVNMARRLVDRGHVVMLLIDACHAGQVAESAGIDNVLLAKGPSQGGLILLASCASAQISKDGADNGHFTKALIEALQGGADLDESGAVSLKEVELFLPWRMRQLTRETPKYPGIAWSEQDVLCVSSFRVPDRLAIARSQGRGPILPSAANRLPTPGPGFKQQPNLPVGVWKEVKTYAKPDGTALQSVYVLEVRADGTYAAYFKDPAGGVEQGIGQYQPASLGFRATLAYVNGYDTINVNQMDATSLEVEVFPSRSFQIQPSKFILKRVE